MTDAGDERGRFVNAANENLLPDRAESHAVMISEHDEREGLGKTSPESIRSG